MPGKTRALLVGIALFSLASILIVVGIITRYDNTTAPQLCGTYAAEGSDMSIIGNDGIYLTLRHDNSWQIYQPQISNVRYTSEGTFVESLDGDAVLTDTQENNGSIKMQNNGTLYFEFSGIGSLTFYKISDTVFAMID